MTHILHARFHLIKKQLLAAWPIFGCCLGVFALGSAEFEVVQPRPHGGPALNAADFGVSVENPDNAAAINRALLEAKRMKASRLDIPKGVYRCHGPVGIVLDGLEDFVLDAHDSLFLFWRKHPNDWDARRYRSDSAEPEAGGLRFDAATRIVEFGNSTEKTEKKGNAK